MSQAKPIAQTWPCSAGQGMWPAVGWRRKRPGQGNLCRALRLPRPITAEPLQAVGTYTPSLDTPALNGSSHRWTGSPLQSHTYGRDTNIETHSELQIVKWVISRFGLKTSPNLNKTRNLSTLLIAPVGYNVHSMKVWDGTNDKQMILVILQSYQ